MSNVNDRWIPYSGRASIKRWRVKNGVVEAIINSYCIRVDEEDILILLNNCWYISGRTSHQLQTRKRINGVWKSVTLQRMIIEGGDIPIYRKKYIRHIDGDWTNNRRSNLREAGV